MIPGLLEALMLICFGAAWPFSIYKSYTSWSTKGKSLLFMSVLELGYTFGILNKIVNGTDYVLWLYVLNMAMVAIDIALYVRNMRFERSQEC